MRSSLKIQIGVILHVCSTLSATDNAFCHWRTTFLLNRSPWFGIKPTPPTKRTIHCQCHPWDRLYNLSKKLYEVMCCKTKWFFFTHVHRYEVIWLALKWHTRSNKEWRSKKPCMKQCYVKKKQTPGVGSPIARGVTHLIVLSDALNDLLNPCLQLENKTHPQCHKM